VRDYGTVRPQFWTRGTGKRLRGDADAQRVAFYLMTCPAVHMTGLYYLPLPTLCHEIGIPLEGATKALARLEQEGFAFYDEEAELVFVVNLAREQVGESLAANDNKVRGVWKHVAGFKNHRFFAKFVEIYGRVYHLPVELQAVGFETPLEDPTKPLESPSRACARVPVQDLVPALGLDPDALAEVEAVRSPPDRFNTSRLEELFSVLRAAVGGGKWRQQRTDFTRLEAAVDWAKRERPDDPWAACCESLGKFLKYATGKEGDGWPFWGWAQDPGRWLAFKPNGRRAGERGPAPVSAEFDESQNPDWAMGGTHG